MSAPAPPADVSTFGAFSPAFDWEGTWKSGLKEGELWDRGQSHPALRKLVGSGRLPSSGRALVPGCGRGYDVALLASRDLRVTGLELIADAASTARSYVSHHAPEKAGFWDVQNGDFFQHTPSEPYDLVYDHTFLCALFPSARPKWASRMAELLRSGGVLVTQMWPLQPDDLLDLTEGPPFSLSKRVYAALLEPAGFSLELLEDIPPKDMIPGRRGVEAIGVWRRL